MSTAIENTYSLKYRGGGWIALAMVKGKTKFLQVPPRFQYRADATIYINDLLAHFQE